MNRQTACWLALALATVLMGPVNQAWSQPRATSYRPGTPPISPYFGYSQVNTTGLPNYYAYVRPQEQLRSLAQNESLTATQQTPALTSEKLQLQVVERLLQMRPSTGIGAEQRAGTFMNYSHYYTVPSQTGRR
jgi:hypothetical protein